MKYQKSKNSIIKKQIFINYNYDDYNDKIETTLELIIIGALGYIAYNLFSAF